MIGLKIALAGVVVWFAFALCVQKLDERDGAIWYVLSTLSFIGLLMIPAGLIFWVFE